MRLSSSEMLVPRAKLAMPMVGKSIPKQSKQSAQSVVTTRDCLPILGPAPSRKESLQFAEEA